MNLKTSLLLAILAVGCAGDTTSRADDDVGPGTEVETPREDTELPSRPDTTQSRPDQTPNEQGSPDAAAGVVRAYYNAIASRDYARAYALWANNGQASGQSFDAFRAGFAQTASVEARVGTPGRIEGAAGSRYIEIPVTIHAVTTAGADQCFDGTYTLRRSEVDGATAEQRSWRMNSASIRARPAAECNAQGPSAAADSARQVVVGFGKQLASVSLLAPADVLRREMRARYGPYVTPPLLERWLATPAEAPGRQVSSPWPDRIEVARVESIAAGRYRVTGDIVLVTSSEQGSNRAAARDKFSAEVIRTAGGWRISNWR